MRSIISSFEPTVEIEELAIPEFEAESDFENNAKKVGSYAPFIVINSIPFQVSNLDYCEIDCDGFLPRITLIVKEMREFIINEAFPMDGDIIQVYMRSKNPDFKPIRADFRITKTDSMSGASGLPSTYTMEGVLNLPEIFVDRIASFGSKSSIQTLQQVAKDLKLGFASNVTSTTDVMRRVCCDISYFDFILEDIMPSCYRSDETFFDCYIDPWYNLVLVEMNELLAKEHDPDRFSKITLDEDWYKNSPDKETEPEDFILQNYMDKWNQSYFSAFSAHSNSGEVFMTIGYRNYLKFYDKTEKKLKEYFLETMNAPNTKSKSKIQKGRENEDHTKFIRNYYLGDQFTDNVHKNFYYARLQNYINNLELEKTTLGLTVSNYNALLMKGSVVPVVIVNKDALKLVADTGEADGTSVNETFSGDYVVRGIRYCYSVASSAYCTKVKLSKREFLKPKWQRSQE